MPTNLAGGAVIETSYRIAYFCVLGAGAVLSFSLASKSPILHTPASKGSGRFSRWHMRSVFQGDGIQIDIVRKITA